MTTSGSLRARLLLAGVVGVLLAALASAVLLGAAFERSAQRAFDRTLDEELDTLIGLAEVAPDGRVVLRREPSGERYDRVFSGWYWTVGEGASRRHSRSFWDSAELAVEAAPADGGRLYDTVDGPRDQRLRVVEQRVRFDGALQPQVFAVAGDLAPVAREVREFRLLAALAVALIATILLIAIGLQVQFGLRPFRRLAHTLARIRNGEELRFADAPLPHELAPLGAQIDTLLDDHARRVQRARNAAQDLAHALKTPLAVLAAESERAGPELPRRVTEEVSRMRAAVERHLAGNLGADSRKRTPVAEVSDALLALMRRVHAARGLTLIADVAADAVFAGSADDLEEMLGNLLDNACKWARSEVTLAASLRDDGLCIEVRDDGPGLDADAATHALQRGVRLDQRAPGSGLGLDIVSGIAASYGGTLTLDRAPSGGVCARLVFV
ncbi:ATP-binding protein [Chiayiivirga flava]|uniref:histidine kinase n=1 Tax=Chiayiivirga flava TaxID=659595 RepID=A0A7W8D7L7_9GAMM|nr:signal transduction histidine kinase [Chiayiivirga flava]